MTELLSGALWIVAVGLIVVGIILIIGIAAAVRGIRARRQDPSTNNVDMNPRDVDRTR